MSDSNTEPKENNEVSTETTTHTDGLKEVSIEEFIHQSVLGELKVAVPSLVSKQLSRYRLRGGSEGPPGKTGGDRPHKRKAAADADDWWNESPKKSKDSEEEDHLSDDGPQGDDTMSLADGEDIQKEIERLMQDGGGNSGDESDAEGENVFSMHADVTERLSAAINADKLGPPLQSELSKLLKTLWTQKTGNAKLVKAKIDDLALPENCTFFKPQRINEDIYGKLRKDITAQDNRFKKSELFLSMAGISVGNMLKTLMSINIKKDTPENWAKAKESITQVKLHATDAFTMLGYMRAGIVQHRKDKIARSVNKSVRGLRNIHAPDSSWLFGDDLPAKLNLMSKNDKSLTKNISSSTLTRSGDASKSKNWSQNKNKNSKNSQAPSWKSKSQGGKNNQKGGKGKNSKSKDNFWRD